MSHLMDRIKAAGWQVDWSYRTASPVGEIYLVQITRITTGRTERDFGSKFDDVLARLADRAELLAWS